MKKIWLVLCIAFPLCFGSCGGDDGTDSDSEKEQEKVKVDLTSVWKEISNNKESVISFAKDGTYKMMLKQKNSIYYFISTGRYSIDNGHIICKDNCVDAASKTYSYSTTKDGELVFEGKTFIKNGVEENAFENKISGTSHEYGGYTISKNYKTIGECNYIMQFTNDYRAYRIIEKVYWDGSSKGSTTKDQYHYIYFDGELFLAEENSSMSPKYFFEVANSNYTEIYYYDETGTKKLP